MSDVTPASEASRARSRVWTLGLRNPCRVAVRPGTGAANPSAGDPGSMYILDVGWEYYEELTIAKGPGENHGWPAFEGIQVQQPYWDAAPQNRDAANPLAGRDVGLNA